MPTANQSAAAAGGSGSMLQLQLENSDLRTRLEDVLSHADESKEELLSTIDGQNQENAMLRSKIESLSRGLVEIDKERARLKSSCDAVSSDARAEVESLKGHLSMREREVRTMAVRIDEQERRIETLKSDAKTGQERIDQYEAELEELIGMCEGYRAGRERAESDLAEAARAREEQDREINEGKAARATLEGDLRETRRRLEEEAGLRSEEARYHAGQLSERDSEISGLRRELESARTASEVLKVDVQSRLERAREENEAHDQAMRDENDRRHREVVAGYESKLTAAANKVSSLDDELVRLRSAHAEKVRETESFLAECREGASAIERSYNEQVESTRELEAEVVKLREEHSTRINEMESQIQDAERESEGLAEELDGCKSKLNDAEDRFASAVEEKSALQQQVANLKQSRSDLVGQIDGLKGEMDTTTTTLRDELAQKSNKIAELEASMSSEKAAGNKLRSQLRETNLRLKDVTAERERGARTLEKELSMATEEVSRLQEANERLEEHATALQRDVKVLEDELAGAVEELEGRTDEVQNLRAAMQRNSSQYSTKIREIKAEHEAEMTAIETRGADVVSDLEETIARLRGEADEDKANIEQLAAEKDRRAAEQDEKIEALTAYAKERKEEAVSANAELARARQSLESAERAHEEKMQSLRDELREERDGRAVEMAGVQRAVDGVRSELSAAQERLSSEDDELNRTKATLAERTDLLRDMVSQTQAYQSDLEAQVLRSSQLAEANRTYKRQLKECREAVHSLQSEMSDKDTSYCDVVRNERAQRKVLEADLEETRLAMDEAVRSASDREREAARLRDKVTRQENYIARLQESAKQNRRATALGGGRVGHRARTSLAPAGKHVVPGTKVAHYGADGEENDRPNQYVAEEEEI